MSKVALATDLEPALSAALRSEERRVDGQIEALKDAALQRAWDAAEAVVREKTTRDSPSESQARQFENGVLNP